MDNDELRRAIDGTISTRRIHGAILIALVSADSLETLTDEQRKRLERLLEY